jgi:polyisoprenoid-binding protein YceI
MDAMRGTRRSFGQGFIVDPLRAWNYPLRAILRTPCAGVGGRLPPYVVWSFCAFSRAARFASASAFSFASRVRVSTLNVWPRSAIDFSTAACFRSIRASSSGVSVGCGRDVVPGDVEFFMIGSTANTVLVQNARIPSPGRCVAQLPPSGGRVASLSCARSRLIAENLGIPALHRSRKIMKLKYVAPLLLIALPALGQMPPPPTKDPAKIPAGAYAVEPNHTEVLWGVSHMGFTTYYGQFTAASGSLTLDPAHPDKSEVDVTIQTGSVSTAVPKLTDELKSADWLDATQFPTAEFKSTKVTVTGDKAKILGSLTLHGVTKPVTLVATLNGGGPNPMDKKFTVGFQATGKIKRSDFGVTKYVPLIGDEVDLIISAPFEQQ